MAEPRLTHIADEILSRAERALRCWVVAGSVGLVVLAWLLLGVDLWLRHGEAVEHATSHAEELARVFEEQAVRTMEAVDLMLQATISDIEGGTLGTPRLDAILAARLSERPYLRNINVSDAAGTFIHSSQVLKAPVSIADRNFFNAHIFNKDAGLVISEPLVGRIRGEPMIAVSRRYQTRDGQFAGVVVAALEPGYFASFYRTFNFGREGAVSLLKSDATLLVRAPANDTVGRRLVSAPLFTTYLPRSSSGTGRHQSELSGEVQLLAYRSLKELPLVVSVALSETEVLAEWRSQAMVQGLVALLVPLGIGGLALILLGQLRSREEAEAQLRDSSRRYRTVLETTLDGWWELDGEGRITEANAALGHILLMEPDELIGKPVTQLASPAGVKVLRRHLGELRRHRGAADEVELLRKDGVRVICRISSTGLGGYWETGGAFSFIADISREMRDAARLKESDSRLRLVIDAAHEGIWDWNLGTDRVVWSGHFRRMLGLPRHMATQSFASFIDRVHPDDRAPFLRAIQDHLDKLMPFSCELRMRRADGSFAWFATSGSAMRDEAGRPLRMVGSLADITERRRSEETLRKLSRAVEQSSSAIFITDPRDVVEYVNARFTALTGFTAAEVVGQPRRVLLGGEESGRIAAICVDGGEWSGEVCDQRRDGSLVWVHLSISPVRTDGGELTNIVGIADDITERRQLEEERLHAQKMEALGHLTGGVAHDFNNLLTIMLGNLEMAEDLAADRPELVELLEVVRRMARRGASMTDRLLTLFRRQPLVSESVDVNAVVLSMHDLISRSLGAAISVRISECPGAPRVVADCARLENAVLNLALNARDAMPGGGSLTITTEVVDLPAGAFVAIRVADTGTGMPPDVLAKALKPFFTTKAAGRGTGLGLSTIQKFCEQYGGEVSIRSREGEGTTVSLLFPVHAGAPEAQGALPAPAAGGSETVLVVEDEAELRRVTISALEGLGYRVLVAGDAAQALELLENGPAPDLLFSDVVMPGAMNGFALAQRIRAERPGLPILLTSGHVDRFEEEGQFPMLRKPYDRAALASAVRAVLEVRTATLPPPLPGRRDSRSPVPSE